mgnify:FL=1
MKLILVRHGQTDSNIRGTYLGWTDVELNETGLKQAECVAEKLKDTVIDKIFSSPLKRVRATAEAINKYHNVSIEYTDCLKERNFGIWDNLTYDEIKAGYPEECIKWDKDWFNYKIKGGESCLEMYERITAFIDDILARYKDETVLLVSHLGCIRIIISYLLVMPPEGIWKFRASNCGITTFSINEDKFAYMTSLNV